jgi:tRNA-splicing ligase RtcB (3'-phosphate/5'-hydroxy nucleic acid ligase)
VAAQLLQEVDSGATLDRHASDQIIPFAAVADGTSRFQVPFVTEHTETAGCAGRVMSRHRVARTVTGPQQRRQLERQGIAVRGASARGLAAETPQAYKDVTQSVAAAEGAGLCRKAARLVPLGVVKG